MVYCSHETTLSTHLQSGPKNCTPTVSQQIVVQCVPIKLGLTVLSHSAYKSLPLFEYTTPYLCIWLLLLKVFIVCIWYQGCGVGVP